MNPIKSRLEEVKMLKAEYGISSENALRYLKIQDEYSGLRGDLIPILRREGIQYKPSVKEISNICNEAMDRLEKDLFTSNKAAFEQLEAEGKVNMRPVTCGVSLPRETLLFRGEVEPKSKDLWWKFDYKAFLVEYARIRDETGSHFQAFSGVMKAVEEGDGRYFTGPEGRFSYQEIASSPKYTSSAEEILDTQENEPIWDGLREKISQNPDMEPNDIIKSLFAVVFTGEGVESKDEPPFSSERPTMEERHLLHGQLYGVINDLYGRAEREHTLGRLETERRIALAFVADAKREEQPHPGVSESERIDYILRSLDEKYRVLSESLATLARANSIDEDVSKRPQLVRNRYTRRALITNRKWIEKLLDS